MQAGFVVTVYDEDLTSDDQVGSDTFTLQDVAAGGYTSGPFGGVLDLVFELRQP